MEQYVKYLNIGQLLSEMRIIKESIKDAIQLKRENSSINFCIGNSYKNLGIVKTEYLSRF